MMMKKLLLALLLVALLPTVSASEPDSFYRVLGTVPAAPRANQMVHAIVQYGGCAPFRPARSVDGVLRIERLGQADCFAVLALPVTLGALPAGDYMIEVGAYVGGGAWVVDSRSRLSVAPQAWDPDDDLLYESADLTGQWAATERPGSGLSILMRDQVFTAVLATFEAGRPTWYLLHGQLRRNATLAMYELDGPTLFAPGAAPPVSKPIGTAEVVVYIEDPDTLVLELSGDRFPRAAGLKFKRL